MHLCRLHSSRSKLHTNQTIGSIRSYTESKSQSQSKLGSVLSRDRRLSWQSRRNSPCKMCKSLSHWDSLCSQPCSSHRLEEMQLNRNRTCWSKTSSLGLHSLTHRSSNCSCIISMSSYCLDSIHQHSHYRLWKKCMQCILLDSLYSLSQLNSSWFDRTSNC